MMRMNRLQSIDKNRSKNCQKSAAKGDRLMSNKHKIDALLGANWLPGVSKSVTVRPLLSIAKDARR
jgi:hypothetical protein